MGRQLTLQDSFKQCTDDQDKIISPEETVKRFHDKLKLVNLDILESVTRIDNGRLDIPVYFSVCGKDAARLTGTKKQMGKGATPEQAKASAVMELCERFSLFSFKEDPENFVIDTYENLKDRALPFELIAQSVHDTTEDLEGAKKIFSTLPLKWTTASNLTTGEDTLIPFDWFFAINEFNGSSAGNSNEEAICQGLSEIVERDVSARISHGKIKTPGIDPDSVKDRLAMEMLKKYEKEGIRVHLSDFSLDTDIPTVGVLAYDPETFPESSELVWTAGTAPDPEKALSRALSEVAQLAGDFNTNANYVASGLPKYQNLEQTRYITETDSTITMDQLPNKSNDNIRVEIEGVVNALKNRNRQVIVVNATHRDLDTPAFYTIVPGAHFRELSEDSSVGMFATRLIADNNTPETALKKLEEADAILPGKYYIKFYMGLCMYNAGDPQGALNCFREALSLSPAKQELPSIHSYMGGCLRDLGRPAEALECAEMGLALDREREDLFNLKGVCLFMMKEHEKAIDAFMEIVALNPSSGINYANIASNYRDLGNSKKAVTYYKTALSIDPTLDFARENLKKLS